MRSSILVVFVLSAILLAQGVQPMNPFSSVFAPQGKQNIQNGAWAMYKMVSNDEGETGKMKFSIVGEDERDGEKCHWFEIEIWQGEDHSIMKFLSKGGFTEDKKDYSSIIVKSNDEPAYEIELNSMPQQNMAYSQHNAQMTAEENVQQNKKTKSKYSSDNDEYNMEQSNETITVPAGKFDCIKYTTIDKETNEKTYVWVSQKVALLGIVKMESNDGEFTLLDYGDKGAKSQITEKPKKFSWRDMMKQQMKESADEEKDDATGSGLKSIFGK